VRARRKLVVSQHRYIRPEALSASIAVVVRDMSTSAPRIAFISGPIDATEVYFAEHYVPRIAVGIEAGDSFVMGPVLGVDTLALQYLLAQGVEAGRITVYMAEFEYRNLQHRNELLGLGINVKEVYPKCTNFMQASYDPCYSKTRANIVIVVR